MKTITRMGLVCAFLSMLIFTSCRKDRPGLSPETPAVNGPDLEFYALSSNNVLLHLNAKDVSSVTRQVTISGLQTAETLLGIDFRPATGQLYGVGSQSHIYVINPQTGVARLLTLPGFTPGIVGTAVGFDFNPAVDRIRLITSTGQNLRLHPETGMMVMVDGAINGAAGAVITSAAYTQNRAGTASTVLFVIDAATDMLYKQDPPNNGTLVAVGSLGFDIEQAGDFDISPDGKIAIAPLKVAGKTNLYSIDIATGKATKIAKEFNGTILGLAIPTEPVAYAVSAMNELVIFNPMNPTQLSKPITGLATAETVLGLDFRPVNGQLYALGSSNRLYTINIGTGAATAVSATPFGLLAGTDFGFDFNPQVDRIRIVSNTRQNLRVHPETGALVMADVALTLPSASVTAAAYTNNFPGTTSTVLYDIDTQNNTLYKQDPPNDGGLTAIGPLGVTATASNGFDIGSTSGTAYALLTVGGVTKVYTINLSTGAATAGATVTGNLKAFTVGLGF